MLEPIIWSEIDFVQDCYKIMVVFWKSNDQEMSLEGWKGNITLVEFICFEIDYDMRVIDMKSLRSIFSIWMDTLIEYDKWVMKYACSVCSFCMDIIVYISDATTDLKLNWSNFGFLSATKYGLIN